MAAVTEVRTFWSALLSVLLKCIAALGFAAPARTAAARTEVADAAATRTEAAAAVRTSVVAANPPGAARVPAPRAYEPLRRDRDRTLPPTMKQRINAEAHGSSPSARSLPSGDLLGDDFAGAVAVPASVAAPVAAPAAHRLP
jgi:hypothetical protein